MTFEKAAEFCFQRYLENKSLLVVLNTKSSAIQMFNSLDVLNGQAEACDKAEIIHLSTNMCPEHRRDSIKKIKALLSEGKNVICVTTQLIEAGVDISFKCVVRSLAGMDNAAQAAGRCNRNGEYPRCPVYVIRITEENLGKHLNEIKCAQAVSTQLLGCGGFGDSLSVQVLTEYFKKYYNEMKAELAYKVKDLGVDTTLINMLSDNTLRWDRKKPNIRPYCQAFASAGKSFRVIKDNPERIIVPYNREAEEIILGLNSSATPNELSALLRRAQKYLVAVHQNTKKELETQGALYAAADGGITVLKKGFYDETTGVNAKGSEQFEFCL